MQYMYQIYIITLKSGDKYISEQDNQWLTDCCLYDTKPLIKLMYLQLDN